MKVSNDTLSRVGNNYEVWDYFKKITVLNWSVTAFKRMCSHSRSRQVNILKENEKVPGHWGVPVIWCVELVSGGDG